MNKNQKSLLWAAAGAGAWLVFSAIRKRKNAYSFRNKVVMITGGSRGLGLVLARQLAAEGARLAICARNEVQLAKAQQELEQSGATVLATPCDLTDPKQVDHWVERTMQEYGQVDVLINNAGTIQVGPLEHMQPDDFEKAMRIHFWAPLYTMLAVQGHMKQRGEGRIVNISSIGGKVSVPHILPYSASKFALTGLSEGFRAALQKYGIVVTTVCPGLMRTGSPRNIIVKGQKQKEYAWFSISDSLSISAASAERSAREIINACRHGQAELITTVPAKAVALLHGLAPGLTADLMALVNRLLPGPDEKNGDMPAKGYESFSAWSPSGLTENTEKAAIKNNEL